jgi:hypothetical protein
VSLRLAACLVAAALLSGCGAAAQPTNGPGASGGASDEIPATVLGTFDQPALEARFGTVFTHEDLTEEKSRYTSDYRLPLGLEFTIHPSDTQKRVLETSVRLSTSRPADQVAVEKSWFHLMERYQPDVLAWLARQRDDYLAHPDADASVRSMFGPVCAGFFAFGSATSLDGRPTTMGYFVETQDAHVNCHGTPDGS